MGTGRRWARGKPTVWGSALDQLRWGIGQRVAVVAVQKLLNLGLTRG